MSNAPLTNALSRVWILDGRARPDHAPEFANFMKAGGVDESFGSVNRIEEPSKREYGKFEEVGEFRDASERPTSSLVGHYALSVKSRILQLAQQGCKIDVQLHLGQCEDASKFNDFQKVFIFEGVIIEDYSTDDLGALESGEQAKVDETGDFSAKKMYEFVPLTFAARSPTDVTNELLDVTLCDSPSCGDCDTESTGCKKVVAISSAAGGSPGTPADIVYTIDGGLNWFAHDIDTLGIAVDPAAVACVGDYAVVITSTNGDEMHIVLASELDGVTDPAFTQVLTGFVASGEPTDIYSLGSTAYLCGLGGFVYKTEDPASGVTPIDQGVATTNNLRAIYMLSEEFGVAVGDDGAIVTITNDLVGAVAISPVGVGITLQAVFVKSDREWFIGSDAGTFFYTLDAGATWTQITLPGTTPSAITDIQMSSDSIMYVSATVSGKGEIYISVNGGQSFVRSPRGSSNAMPNNDGINAIAVCEWDVDFVVGAGLAADGTDGFIVVGSD